MALFNLKYISLWIHLLWVPEEMQHHIQDARIHFSVNIFSSVILSFCYPISRFSFFILGNDSETAMDIGLSPRKSSLQDYSHDSPQRSTTTCMLGLVIQVLRSTMCFYRKLQKGNLHERSKFAQQGLCQILKRAQCSI